MQMQSVIMLLLGMAGGGVIAINVLYEKHKKRLEEVTDRWRKARDEVRSSWKEDYKSLSATLERERAEKYNALNKVRNLEKTVQYYEQGLKEISKRQYLQVGQMKAPGATFRPPWEIAADYLKKGRKCSE